MRCLDFSSNLIRSLQALNKDYSGKEEIGCLIRGLVLEGNNEDRTVKATVSRWFCIP